MNGEDRNEIAVFRAEVLGWFSLVNAKLDQTIKTQADQEARLRSVERWKLSIPISMLLAIATIVGAIMSRGGG